MPGPRPKIDENSIRSLINSGHSKKDIATILNIGYSTIKKHSVNIKKPKKEYKCKICNNTNENNFYKSKKHWCKKCWNTYTHQKTTDKFIEYMNNRGGAKCQRCGYDKCSAALEFHHRNPLEKDPTWSKGWKLEKLSKELDKCDILCANCHREVHVEMRIKNTP